MRSRFRDATMNATCKLATGKIVSQTSQPTEPTVVQSAGRGLVDGTRVGNPRHSRLEVCATGELVKFPPFHKPQPRAAHIHEPQTGSTPHPSPLLDRGEEGEESAARISEVRQLVAPIQGLKAGAIRWSPTQL
jgi:hypothetical protein